MSRPYVLLTNPDLSPKTETLSPPPKVQWCQEQHGDMLSHRIGKHGCLRCLSYKQTGEVVVSLERVNGYRWNKRKYGHIKGEAAAARVASGSNK